ncbi:MAG: hypothetical protein O2845_01100 [Proteobacteria bacterium]|nr:hypothetical protein [Pseudomonadota bacterium]
MASAFIRHPPGLGVPTLEVSSGATVNYPHLVMRIANIAQRSTIAVGYGSPEANMGDDMHHFVQHPTPFDDDGTLSIACRVLLIAALQEDIGRSKSQVQKCLVWSPSSCSYVEVDGSTCEVTDGPAMKVGAAFDAARQAVIRGKYPQIHVKENSGITSANCPVHATKEDIVAQAIGIVMNSGNRVRIAWSESETIYAELTDKLGAKSEPIRPCVVWSECAGFDDNSGQTLCDTKLNMESPHMVISLGHGGVTHLLFYPDTLTKEELIAKGAELMHLRPEARVCVVFSSTESIWPSPPQLDVVW